MSRNGRPYDLVAAAGAALALALSAGGCSLVDRWTGRGAIPEYRPPEPPAPAGDAERATPAVVSSTGATGQTPVWSRFAMNSLPPTVAAPVQTEAVPGRVNVFGEVDGRPTPAPRFAPGGYEQVTFVDEGYDTDVEVSPDGKWLVFASTRHNERPEIYLQRVGGLSVTQLTNDEADDAFPTFSPDGRRVAFASTRNGSWDLYVMDVDGRNLTQVTSTPHMQELHPSFSPDGSRLAYCATGTRSGQWELWVVDLQSNQRRMVGYGLFPVWSPRTDKDQIAFQRARQRGSRWFSLWTADLVDGEARSVTEVAVSANAAIVSPAWSPQGDMLTFSTIVNPSTASDGRTGGQQDIWVINADGTGRRRITDGNGVNATPSWARDGRIYFVSDRGGADAIWAAPSGRTPPAQRAAQPNAPDAQGATDPFASSADGN